MSEPAIPPVKPFLVRAIYEWCIESGFTPYIAVVVDANTRVPMEYVRDGEIVLNIGPVAANKLNLGNDAVELQARFGGVAREIYVPISAVSSVYARENGRGMSFDTENSQSTSFESDETASASPSGSQSDALPTPPDTPPTRPQGKPTLRRIK